MSATLELKIEAEEPLSYTDARWVTLKLANVVIFNELCYDTDHTTNERSEEMAIRNFGLIFASKIREVIGNA